MKLRRLPEDFEVEELAEVALGGGPFALYRLTKRSLGTPEAVQAVRKRWKLPPDSISFGGLKDRHAVTRQAFTVPLAHETDVAGCLGWAGDGYAVLGATRHGRKLRPGSHRANRFVLRVRELAPTTR